MRRDLERAVRNIPDIELDADSSAARRRIVEIRRELASLSGKRIGIDVDARQAHARMQELSRELARLGAQEPNIQLRADTLAGSAQLAGIGRQVRHLDGQSARISVNANEVSRAITVVGLLTAGVSVLGAAAIPAAAALGAIPAAAAGGLQVAGALGAGFVGVGDALKEMENAEKSAATTATSAASSQVAARGGAVADQNYATCPTCGRPNEPRAELTKTQKTVDEMVDKKRRAYDDARAAWLAASATLFTARNNTRQLQRGIGVVDNYGRSVKKATPKEMDLLVEANADAEVAERAARRELDEAIAVRDAAMQAAAEANEMVRASVDAAIAEARRARDAAVDAAVRRAMADTAELARAQRVS